MHNSNVFQCYEKPKVLINCSHLVPTTTPNTLITTETQTPELESTTTESSTENIISSSITTSETTQSNTEMESTLETTESLDTELTLREEESTEWITYSDSSVGTKTDDFSETPELDYQTSDSLFDWSTRVDRVLTTKRRRDQPFGPEEYWIVLCIIAILLTVMAAFCGICIICYMPKEMRKTDPSSGMHCIHLHIWLII